MQLRTLVVENFRGIRQARLDLDADTVLIGENDCGKTTLLEAISFALAPGNGDTPQFVASDFYRPGADSHAPPAGPIRIELGFREGRAGEWEAPEYAPLADLIGRPAARPRELRLTLSAVPPARNASTCCHWQLRCQGSGRTPCADAAEYLPALRDLVPFIWLRGGTLFTAPAALGRDPGVAATSVWGALATEVESRFQALIGGTLRESPGKLRAGYRAALSLLAQHRPAPATLEENDTRPVIAEILGRDSSTGRRLAAYSPGSAAEQLGTIVLTAAILRHLPEALAPGAHPILALEDPEAHLHPMTLASVWGLLQEIGAQRIVTTQSQILLAAAPLRSVRRLMRYQGRIRQWQMRPGALEAEELRKMSYHLRARHGVASFARCWLLVEGETEFWMLPELARLCGYDFELEGVACVEFAQCGLTPLIKLAREWGIEWHVLADGDEAGRRYAEAARRQLHGEPAPLRLTALHDRDVEHCFWQHGYANVFVEAAGLHLSPVHRPPPRGVINRAIRRHSKPYLAIEMVTAVAGRRSPGVPAPLRTAIETCVDLARAAPRTSAEAPPPLGGRRRSR